MSIDIAEWLRGLGLEQYASAFRDNDIDGEILGGMNAEDLKELGISSFGHRRKLLTAITALAPATRDVAQSARARHCCHHLRQSTRERRQLTVMFCDLVGSTPLSARLRSRGSARGHRRLPSLRRRHRRPLRRFCRQVHGRRRADLFRLSRGA